MEVACGKRLLPNAIAGDFVVADVSKFIIELTTDDFDQLLEVQDEIATNLREILRLLERFSEEEKAS
tara:strand:- start:1402 stop:1602 length:201 start_codon:yes stop_codon:yes gene_type:complete